ncbi:MAG: helix-turn-helix domain-containing protein [Candidatus Bathyarchaeota archaeon]|nr:helix-turn-helix domain-containing protein [Candidatus Bathyarchaeota archaeon]
MNPRCEAIGKYVVPLFRSMLAKELINTYNLTQVEAAQRLGTTQAAISQYVNSKRANRGMEQFDDIVPKIQAMASETAKRLANKEISPEEVTIDFCKLCSSLCCK